MTLVWPWPNDLDTQAWPGYCQDVPPHQKWSFYVNWFKSYNLNRHTDKQTDRHTDTMKTLLLPLTQEVIIITMSLPMSFCTNSVALPLAYQVNGGNKFIIVLLVLYLSLCPYIQVIKNGITCKEKYQCYTKNHSLQNWDWESHKNNKVLTSLMVQGQMRQMPEDHCIYSNSHWFCESQSFSHSVKTTGIGHIAVLADSNDSQ